ncbi:MAG: hypothetical protein ACRDD8_16470 [Bacteroidales bacterium]
MLEKWLEERDTKRSLSGVVNKTVYLQIGDTVDDAYKFMNRVKFSEEHETECKVIIEADFNGVMLDTDMTKDDMEILLFISGSKQYKK